MTLCEDVIRRIMVLRITELNKKNNMFAIEFGIGVISRISIFFKYSWLNVCDSYILLYVL